MIAVVFETIIPNGLLLFPEETKVERFQGFRQGRGLQLGGEIRRRYPCRVLNARPTKVLRGPNRGAGTSRCCYGTNSCDL